jgi:hopanoid-associated phosphorylase
MTPDIEAGGVLAVVGMTREAKILAGTAALIGGGNAAVLGERLMGALSRRPAGVISFGLCGALDPALEVGAILIGETVVDERALLQADPAWTRRLVEALPEAVSVRFAGAVRPVGSPEEKAQLRQATGAAAVDLETVTVARLARRFGVPFAVLRAVSDDAGRVLPHAAQVGLGQDGRPAVGAVLASLRANPWQIGSLIRTALEAEDGFHALERARHLLGPRLGGPDLL